MKIHDWVFAQWQANPLQGFGARNGVGVTVFVGGVDGEGKGNGGERGMGEGDRHGHLPGNL